ncbi:MAG: hypothetical protein IKP43_00835 [Bacteroidaceae bacterium]|jgi:hypothetical protein|nr:hypothetical protein [Bacteroidaceae bacterium]
MKTYIQPEIEEVNYRMPVVICLSIFDDETDESLANQRRDDAVASKNKDPWKDGLW